MKDNVSARINAVIYYKVSDAEKLFWKSKTLFAVISLHRPL